MLFTIWNCQSTHFYNFNAIVSACHIFSINYSIYFMLIQHVFFATKASFIYIICKRIRCDVCIPEFDHVRKNFKQFRLSVHRTIQSISIRRDDHYMSYGYVIILDINGIYRTGTSLRFFYSCAVCQYIHLFFWNFLRIIFFGILTCKSHSGQIYLIFIHFDVKVDLNFIDLAILRLYLG